LHGFRPPLCVPAARLACTKIKDGTAIETRSEIKGRLGRINGIEGQHETKLLTSLFGKFFVSLNYMKSEFHLDKKSVQKFELGQEPKDVIFWRSQPYALRLAALEDIRQAYILWKYGTEQGFQRVYRVVERT
jgi:hypothetical protein